MSNLTPRINRLDDNLLINSQMDFWQRGTSFISVSDVYTTDRFKYSASPALVVDATRSTDVPNNAASYSLNINRNTANSPAASEVSRIFQRIEGNLFKKIRGKKFTIFFYAKSSKVGPRYIRFSNNNNDRYLLQKYTITQADTWQAFQFQLEHVDSGTWLYDSGMGMDVSWTIQAGTSTNTGIAGSWQSGNSQAASDQVNTFDANNSYFRLALPIILEGWWSDIDVTATPFRTYQQELQLCQRYYEKSYLMDIAPGSNSNPGAMYEYQRNGDYMTTQFQFAVNKRAVPTVTLYNTVTGVAGQMRGVTGGGTYAIALAAISERLVSTSTLVSIIEIYAYHWTADAEL